MPGSTENKLKYYYVETIKRVGDDFYWDNYFTRCNSATQLLY